MQLAGRAGRACGGLRRWLNTTAPRLAPGAHSSCEKRPKRVLVCFVHRAQPGVISAQCAWSPFLSLRLDGSCRPPCQGTSSRTSTAPGRSPWSTLAARMRRMCVSRVESFPLTTGESFPLSRLSVVAEDSTRFRPGPHRPRGIWARSRQSYEEGALGDSRACLPNEPSSQRLWPACASSSAHQPTVSAFFPQGDVLSVAQIAGIQGAKLTSQLIPLCHPIALR